MDIRHVVVLMLENRSFDCMLGTLYPHSNDFDGLSTNETNPWQQPPAAPTSIPVWTDATLNATSLCIPDPDPGELFTDIGTQLRGWTVDGVADPGAPPMSGFVDNYLRQTAASPAPDAHAIMHYFTPTQVPVISQLAKAFGVSDRWHASAPCQTWPNRFFVHTATANGYVNNSPSHFPYTMETVFNRLATVGKTSRIYFHDFPQSATLARLWGEVGRQFRFFEASFAQDAANGTLPDYSFIEPRYFADPVTNQLPNDEHPPHNVAYGEALIASVYNAVRAGPGWKQTLLVITYDEHGGCYDHVMPPPATSPGTPADVLAPDGFKFDAFGVRVPAVIISPYVRAGSILRPSGPTPFDHTSILATLRRLHAFAPLTDRDAAAPDLLGQLQDEPSNDGPGSIVAPAVAPASPLVARALARPLNDLQRSLITAALHLPTAGADIAQHIQRLEATSDAIPTHTTVGAAVTDIAAHIGAFLGLALPG